MDRSKQVLRMGVMADRQALSVQCAAAWSTCIRERLLDLLRSAGGAPDSLISSRCVALYSAFRNEVDVADAATILRSDGWVTVFPRVDQDARTMHFVTVDDDTTWSAGAYGIVEPDSGQRVEPGSLDVMVMPGVAFDPAGYRVGFGGGYYDRFLANPDVRALRVGVAYAFQVVDEVPHEPHDQPVHWIVTEQRTMACRGCH